MAGHGVRLVAAGRSGRVSARAGVDASAYRPWMYVAGKGERVDYGRRPWHTLARGIFERTGSESEALNPVDSPVAYGASSPAAQLCQ